MRRVLLVAEGTLHRPVVNILATVTGMSVTLFVGISILQLRLPAAVTVLAILLILIIAAVIQARFGGPREFRVEKPAEGGALRVSGRFQNGEIPARHPRELTSTEAVEGTLVFHVAGESEPYHLQPPAFKLESTERLHAAITEMASASHQAIQARDAVNDARLKFYDAKQLMLLRFTEKPGYMLVTWLVAGLTVIAWILLTPFILVY